MWSFSPEAVQWHLVDGEVIALDTARGEYLSVDGSGALLWSRLADGATEESLAADLTAAYGIDPDVAAVDVGLFLRELHDRRFLTAAA
ncbi:hypothetical protein Asp14428_14820 [Actinoplanes sp. NBRC 14428]|uniref:Coenzyme PQQ synthesis protein D (PqqD) n=1 Tax=Pseudosporangium ferrugineum TaxID=439699 RepID=A0A2T0SAM0_9ACTN|nr:PqqD family protein [Pseudosporangium ferrugineum]PRY30475.1 coenzyme PQQ synthesis protein D (PqqD) [Pseudosporangium ferrugineum]BCJ50007.1 hypothetical protein Asp14428_14820 [Actinoplanes sp. NBRC 14428]